MTPRSTLKVKAIGQRSRSPGQSRDLRFHLTGVQVMLGVKGDMGQDQRSHGSRAKVTKFKVSLKIKVTRSKTQFQVSFDRLTCDVGCQRSHGSMSKDTWVKVSLKVIIFAGGLMSTSSCIFFTEMLFFPLAVLVILYLKNVQALLTGR